MSSASAVNSTATTAPPSSASNSRWIVSPTADLAFFLATPAALALVFWFAETYFGLAALATFSTILAMGHYLPGLMRAYGDPALFQRFRIRFLVAPILFLTAAVIFTRNGSQAFLLLVVLWGAWHWLMQTYGLVRIYDAKQKNTDSWSARLDYALCLSWFGVVYWRTDGAAGALMHYYRAGGRLSPATLRFLAALWLAATVVISILYVAHLIKQIRDGRNPSVIKLTLLAVSWLFYLYAFGMTDSKIVAFGLFEGYHDIQYLAIVWLFNRNRAAKDPSAGAFTRFLFRQRWPLVIVYVGLCLLFGSYDYVARAQTNERIAQTALAIITGFALIHFYFDGFIWRIREPETRSTLDVSVASERITRSGLSPVMRHAMWWAAVAVPIGMLLIWEREGGGLTDLEACQQAVAAMPHSHKAHYALASVLAQQGDYTGAQTHADEAWRLRPGFDLYSVLHHDLALGKPELSRAELDEIIAGYLSAERTRYNSAELQRNLGRAYQRRGDYGDAIERFRRALSMSPPDSPATAQLQFEYASALAQKGQFAAAGLACEQACQLEPSHAEAHALLATLAMALNRPAMAIEHFERALQQDPQQLRWKLQFALALATGPDPKFRDLRRASQLADSIRPEIPVGSPLRGDLELLDQALAAAREN